MMKFNKWTYIIAALCLLGLILIWTQYNNKGKMEKLTWDRKFAIDDVSSISKIILTKKGSEPLVLSHNNNKWILNGKYDTYASPVNNLLEALTKIQMSSIPPKNSYDEIIREFASYALKVQVFDNNENVLRVYYIGGVTDDESGVYMMMEGSKQPYVVKLPAGVSNVRARYDIEEVFWRDRSLFKIDQNQIKQIKVIFPFYPQESFTVVQEKEQLFLKDYKENSVKDVNKSLLKKYLLSYAEVGTESIENTNPERSQISTMTPYLKIAVTLNNGSESVVDIYPINEQTGKIDLSKEFLQSKTFFRMFGNRNDGEFFLFQYSQLGDLAYGLSDLLRK